MAHKIKTKDWEAIDRSENFAGGERILTVQGHVEVNASNDVPHLNATVAAGSTLNLDLTIVQEGIGNQHIQWKTVEFTQTGAFEHVDIIFDGGVIEKLKVAHLVSET